MLSGEKNMEKKLIKDELRHLYLNIINKRIKEGKSTLILGKNGSGKTKLIEQIQSGKRTTVNSDSIASLHYFLASILQQLNYSYEPKLNKIMVYLDTIRKSKNALIIIDEAEDLRSGLFPYIKRIMNSKIPVVIAGLPKVGTRLKEKHEDILCRLKAFNLQPVSAEEFKKVLPQFEPDAVDLIYGYSMGNMWIFDDICEDCLCKIAELKLKKVTVEIAQMFIQT